MAKEDEVPKLEDAEHVNDLLDIALAVKDTSAFENIRAAVLMELAQIDKELWKKLHPDEAEAEEKAQEEREKAEEERQKKLKEEQQKEYKASQEGRGQKEKEVA